MRLTGEDRREQVIRIATRFFSQQGFDGTTTREIAIAAGINEATVFRYFPTKNDLYWAVVSSSISTGNRRGEIRKYLHSGLQDGEVLARIAESLLRRARQDSTLSRLLLFSALRDSKAFSDRHFHEAITKEYDLLSEYFRCGIKEGRFRAMDPALAARGFLGTISNHILLQEIFGEECYQQVDPRILSRQLADLWLNGVRATQNVPGYSGPRKMRRKHLPTVRTKTEKPGIREVKNSLEMSSPVATVEGSE